MYKYIFFLIAVFGLLGCGGGGGGSSLPSPFAGTWEGTYTDNTGGGAVEITVANNGNLAGQVTDPGDLPGEIGSLVGDIDSNGTVEGSYDYPSTSPFSFEGVWALSNGGNTLSGSVLIEGSETANFTLTRQ